MILVGSSVQTHTSTQVQRVVRVKAQGAYADDSRIGVAFEDGSMAAEQNGCFLGFQKLKQMHDGRMGWTPFFDGFRARIS